LFSNVGLGFDTYPNTTKLFKKMDLFESLINEQKLFNYEKVKIINRKAEVIKTIETSIYGGEF
jgi:hypothetical protein